DGNQVTTKHGDHHKEENENKERTKENKEKEERCKDKVKEEKKLKKKLHDYSFEVPTLAEVEAYHQELGITEYEPQEFYDYYEAFGWTSKEGRKVSSWKALMRGWKTNRIRNLKRFNKSTNNVTNKNQQRQAAGAGAQAGQAGDAEEHRQEDLERHLENHHPGDDRLARLAREINQVAQEMGVPTTEYSLRQIAYDAQSLLYKFVWCQGWTDERWREIMHHVARHLKKAAQPGQKTKLDSNVLFEIVYSLSA
ncbi:MAG: hypothetical protein MJZ35_05700, partial [Bacteroidaceae bacterium]|nr:hypothetical protein [Bacteroidaceae bacterium]